MTPRTPAEFVCILNRIAARGDFKYQGPDGSAQEIPRDTVLRAIQEVARAIEGAYVGESTPTACEALVGLLFVSAVEAEPVGVTIAASDPAES